MTMLYIATPCFGSMLHAGYVTSLLLTCNELARTGVHHLSAFLPASLITRARNTLAAQFMASESTHLLFIDADIKWEPDAVMRLLVATCHPEIEVAAGVYPKKGFPLEFAMNFALTPDRIVNEHPDTGYLEIRDAPTGFLMIRRSALERMMTAYPERKCCFRDDAPAGERAFEYALFDCLIDDDGRYLSEDYGFSRLWQRIGGKVWMDPEINLSHFGQHEYRGEIASVLERHRNAGGGR
jgi:hypothetical protein